MPQLVNLPLLIDKVTKSGLKLGAIATEMGVSRPTLRNRLQGTKGDFTLSEIRSLSKILQLTDNDILQIFFKE
jgi:hypothetical protein